MIGPLPWYVFLGILVGWFLMGTFWGGLLATHIIEKKAARKDNP